MALAHPNEPHFTDPLVQMLTGIYRRAYDNTLADLQRAIARGLTTEQRIQLLTALNRRVAELRAMTLAWAYGPIDTATGARQLTQAALYRAVAVADAQTIKQLSALGIDITIPLQGVLINDGAIRVAATNLVQSLDRAIAQFDTSVRGIIGRAENDVFRQTGLRAVADKMAQSQTVRQGRNALIEELQARGIPAFTDAKGRDWTLRSYADMAIRTTTREATSTATLARVQAHGLDYVIATTHNPTCPICAARQGRVYCISGKDPRFPALSTIGNTPWHPNCGHSLVPYSPDYDADLAGTIAASNAPFDIDPRSQREVAQYQRGQAINRERNRKRQLTVQLKAPDLGAAEQARLKRLRQNANERLIKLNAAQRKSIPGWR